jgi:deferrochelatase/peroxidase EfeB
MSTARAASRIVADPSVIRTLRVQFWRIRCALSGWIECDTEPVHSTRRGFLKSGLAGASVSAIGAGLAGTVLAGAALTDPVLANPVLANPVSVADAATIPTITPIVPFYGTHQAGIATPSQEYLQFAAFDLASDSIADLRTLMKVWTDAAAQLSLGHRIGAVRTGDKPPVDTGEAIGLGPAQLTMTFGFGPSLFTSNGVDRFGLARLRPAPLVDLPRFRGDALQADISNGDIGVQVCANDPQVAFHAIHDLIKLARSIAVPRWLLAGFGRTGNSTTAPLPRNLMGFQDGTANIVVEDSAELDQFVWAAEPASPNWMRGGSYLVARRIQIALGQWDSTGLTGQQQAIGREKLSGAVLPVVPPAAHILLASPGANNGQRLLRRGYSYVDGVDASATAPAIGLLFICFNKDPRQQFIAIQKKIAGIDALSPFLTHIGSAVFACPPGAKPGTFVGQELLG